MEHFLTEIEAFCERHQMAETRFGDLALKDKPFVRQVREGRRVWPETQDKVRAWMAAFEAQQQAA